MSGKVQSELAAVSIIRERSVEILLPSNVNVFYNPVQEFNRDLSVTVLNVYFQQLLKEKQEKLLSNAKNNKNNDASENCNKNTMSLCQSTTYKAGTRYEEGLYILEALSATGLRSIRYAQEVAGIKKVIANDLSRKAVEIINKNIKHNKVEHLVDSSHANATYVMYQSTDANKQFDCIDLDPYGCPNRFLDAAIQSLNNGGLLLVTATDMAVLAGNAPEVCYVKYGSVPLRMKSCHEMALRILLHCIDSHANRYGKYIKPLLSISADFYVRVFVRVYSSLRECKLSMSKQSMIYQCTGCATYTLQPLGCIKSNANQFKCGIPTGPPIDSNCEHCHHKHHLGGPIWSAPIHDKSFVQQLLEIINEEPLCNLSTQKRLNGVLTVVLEELHDIPLYYTLDKLCCVLKLEIIPILKFRTALLNAGYKVSYSHACKNSIKTNAPASVLWDVLRCWNKDHPVKKERLLEGTPVKAILEKSSAAEYNFTDVHPESNPKSRKQALARFQVNPLPHWGPGTRATIMLGETKLPKSYRNQNKKQKHSSSQEANQSTTADNLKQEQPLNKLKKFDNLSENENENANNLIFK